MEHKFKSRFLKGLASTSIGMGLQIILGMLGLMITARLISQAQFGAVVLVQVIALFFMILTGMVQESIAVTRYIATAEDREKNKIIQSALCFKVIIAAVISLIIILSKPLICYFIKDESLYKLLMYIPPLFVLNSVDDLLRKILQGLHLYKRLAIAQIVLAISRFVLIVVFLGVLKMDAVGFVYAVLISFVLSVLYQYLAIPGKKQIRFDLVSIKAIAKFSFPLGINGLLTFAYMYLDNIMIAAMLNPVQVAYYSIASKIPENLQRMYASFYDVFFPNMAELLSEKKYVEAGKVLTLSIRLFAFLIAFATIGSAVFQQEIIRILFSEKYLPSAYALPLLMFTLGVNLVGHLLGTTLVALGRADTPAKINSVNTIINLISNFLMIPRFGFIGAVYAKCLAGLVTNPVNLMFLRKTDLQIRQRDYLKPFLLALGCWFIYWLVGIETILFKISLIALFLIACWVFNVIKKEDLQNVSKIVKLVQNKSV